MAQTPPQRPCPAPPPQLPPWPIWARMRSEFSGSAQSLPTAPRSAAGVRLPWTPLPVGAGRSSNRGLGDGHAHHASSAQTTQTALIRHGHLQPRPPPPPPPYTVWAAECREPHKRWGPAVPVPAAGCGRSRGPPQRPVATQHPGISRLRVRSPRSGVGRGDLTPGITARGACRWAPRTPFPQTSGQRATPAFTLADRQRRPRTGPAAPRRAMRQKHATSSTFLPSATQRLHGTRPGPRRERDGAPQAHTV